MVGNLDDADAIAFKIADVLVPQLLHLLRSEMSELRMNLSNHLVETVRRASTVAPLPARPSGNSLRCQSEPQSTEASTVRPKTKTMSSMASLQTVAEKGRGWFSPQAFTSTVSEESGLTATSSMSESSNKKQSKNRRGSDNVDVPKALDIQELRDNLAGQVLASIVPSQNADPPAKTRRGWSKMQSREERRGSTKQKNKGAATSEAATANKRGSAASTTANKRGSAASRPGHLSRSGTQKSEKNAFMDVQNSRPSPPTTPRPHRPESPGGTAAERKRFTVDKGAVVPPQPGSRDSDQNTLTENVYPVASWTTLTGSTWNTERSERDIIDDIEQTKGRDSGTEAVEGASATKHIAANAVAINDQNVKPLPTTEFGETAAVQPEKNSDQPPTKDPHQLKEESVKSTLSNAEDHKQNVGEQTFATRASGGGDGSRSTLVDGGLEEDDCTTTSVPLPGRCVNGAEASADEPPQSSSSAVERRTRASRYLLVRRSSHKKNSTTSEVHLAKSSSSTGTRPSFALSSQMTELRQARVDELVRKHSVIQDDDIWHTDNTADDSSDDSNDSDRTTPMPSSGLAWRPPTLFCICGIFPWEKQAHGSRNMSAWYQRMVLLLSALTVFATIEQTVSARSGSPSEALCYTKACLTLGFFADLPLSLASFLGLLFVGSPLCSKRLVECHRLLLALNHNQDILERWTAWRPYYLVSVLAPWIIAVFERARSSGAIAAAADGTLDILAVIQILSFSISSLILMGLVYCFVDMCRGLLNIVDHFALLLIMDLDLSQAENGWNVLSAVLRKVSSTVQLCFFALQTMVLAVIMLSIVDAMGMIGGQPSQLLALIPSILLVLCIVRIFFCAGAVTDKCVHVPALVNSLDFGEGTDRDRFYIVQYIINSGAGFYAFEIRLTSLMAWKLSYLVSVVVFGISTRIASIF